MSSIKWCVCAALISAVSHTSMAQQLGPPDSVGPNGSNLPVVSKFLANNGVLLCRCRFAQARKEVRVSAPAQTMEVLP